LPCHSHNLFVLLLLHEHLLLLLLLDKHFLLLFLLLYQHLLLSLLLHHVLLFLLLLHHKLLLLGSFNHSQLLLFFLRNIHHLSRRLVANHLRLSNLCKFAIVLLTFVWVVTFSWSLSPDLVS
jgi:hypothetical protein